MMVASRNIGVIWWWLREGVKKTRIFYGQADRKGGVTRPDRSICKILGLKTHWIWFLDTQNTFYLGKPSSTKSDVFLHIV